MNISEILNIVLAVLGVLATLIGYYFKIKQSLINKANGLINDAEDIAKDGDTKMKYVVHELYQTVPLAYRGIFNEEFLAKLVQAVFDKIEDYANKQVNKK